jgi:hypothetical protein
VSLFLIQCDPVRSQFPRNHLTPLSPPPPPISVNCFARSNSTIDDERSKTATQIIRPDDDEVPPFEVKYTSCKTKTEKDEFDEQWLECSPLTVAISMNTTPRIEPDNDESFEEVEDSP